MLRYFLLLSQKMVATVASGPRSSWTWRAPRKFAPEEMPTASPS